ncbi:MAG TPA: hypothetical protein VFX17_02345 [Patescibacteria group bacterium]|nr:hypothetical protein [Patescibacteria group bacterium]
MKWLAICVSVVVAAAIVAGFVAVGSPAKQRKVRLDQTRVQNLQLIEDQVNNYAAQNGHLPAGLGDIASNLPKDPETQNDYTYTLKVNLNYQLCATFDLASSDSKTNYPSYYPASYNESWDHSAGQACFDRTANTNLYPPMPVQ